MKRLLLIVLPLLLIVGCSSPEPINYEETLNERDGVFYTKDTNEPYSGPVFSLYDDGKKNKEGTFKDGKEDGLWTSWYENGQKWRERIYKPDELYSYTVWNRNGIKDREGNYKNGKEDGLYTEWYENGQKKSELNYKDGKKDGLYTGWWENGQKSDEMTFKEGYLDGKSTGWYENNGQKEREEIYKDGDSISELWWNEDGSVKE